MSRFDYVGYDADAMILQKLFKNWCEELAKRIEGELKSNRPAALALTRLEECYMWIGKAIRDDQIERNGAAPLMESRNEG